MNHGSVVSRTIFVWLHDKRANSGLYAKLTFSKYNIVFPEIEVWLQKAGLIRVLRDVVGS